MGKVFWVDLPDINKPATEDTDASWTNVGKCATAEEAKKMLIEKFGFSDMRPDIMEYFITEGEE